MTSQGINFNDQSDISTSLALPTTGRKQRKEPIPDCPPPGSGEDAPPNGAGKASSNGALG